MKLKYLEDGERGAFAFLGGVPVGRRVVTTNTSKVQLQLAGDALLVVNNPHGFLSANFDVDELANGSDFIHFSSSF